MSLEGQTFGKLLVLGRSHRNEKGHWYWDVECQCGRKKKIAHSNLRSGSTVSCGCYGSTIGGVLNKTHGMSKDPFYRSWCSMKDRCLRSTNKRFPLYGGRGIKICKEWMTFENFKNDMLPSYQKGLTLERIDNNGNYCSKNCRWATRIEQARNKQNSVTYKGIHLSEWSQITGLKRATIRRRVFNSGWSWEKALWTPVHKFQVDLTKIGVGRN